ncbi:MAG: hypothetical protein FJW40_01840 [Acidobacteria bacterium]|nr:hypothetical protein [Acidobacteriota bacterium]
MALGLILLTWFFGRYINVNRFSLQALYRVRLIRAFLGASRTRRKPNPFSGFDHDDNIHMHEIRQSQKPLHVINTALNLVRGEKLSWQQRKCASFTISRFHCGNAQLGYRPSAFYGGTRGPKGISLGTAMAISGAAASPNMGYHSSPLVTLMMTLFNVRLGSWMGNPGLPGGHSWIHSGPKSAVTSLISEALGLTNEKNEYVYLSDGGHFDNLGLYEMVLRRVRHIVVIDSGADPDSTFEDLGNALRKTRIDHGIPIEFPEGAIEDLRCGRARCAIGRVLYSAVDPEGVDGTVVYIKPVLRGTETPDVASYAADHPSFPHEPTSDQWFDEPQFESYRRLGEITIQEILTHWNTGGIQEFTTSVGHHLHHEAQARDLRARSAATA